MAKPINIVKKRIVTDQEQKQQSLNHLMDDLAKHESAIKDMMGLVSELHASGILEIAGSMLKARVQIAEIALHQTSRKEVTNVINNLMGTVGVLAETDPEQTKKLLAGVVNGLKEAKEKQDQKVGIMDILKSFKDIRIVVRFGIHFLRGLGQAFK